MTKAIPTIQKFMTCNPITIDSDVLISEAQNVMKGKKVRHLPVMENGAIYGILSDRDIQHALGLLNADPQTIHVKDVCQTHVYVASPENPVDQVADEMAEHQYGCAVIVQNNKLVGIFTTVDVCLALSKIIHERFH